MGITIMRLTHKKSTRVAVGTLFAVALVAGATIAYAVTLRSVNEKAVGRALILPALRIQKNADLNFRSALPGAKAEVIPPKSSRGGAGQVHVVGTPNQAFTLFLPNGVSLSSTGPGTEGRNVFISEFTSFPALGSGALGSIGQLDNLLGATRHSLPRDIPSGMYHGNYTLTVAFP